MELIETTNKSQEMARLNDLHRQAIPNTRTFCTPAVQALTREEQRELFRLIASFDQFEEGDDPYSEHDFGKVKLGEQGETYLWKIDYFDLDEEYHSPDPADPTVTTRVLTVMEASEY